MPSTTAPTDAAPHRVRATVRPAPAWWRDAVGVAVWLNVLAVVTLWVADGNVQALADGWAAALTSLARLAGLVASCLMLVQVLAMARLPVVERSYGQDELARRHRLIGFWSVNLMAAHIALVVAGYTLQVRTTPVTEVWDLVTTYPGMLLAAAGVVALGAVGVTSLRAARRRLRYESWHLLHLYAYLGVGLVLPHQLWTGSEFLTHPVATVYWWTLWAAGVASVLVWRLGVPVWRTLRHDLRVVAVQPEGPGVVSVWMRGRRLDRLRASGGQFFVWRFLAGPGWSRGHPYSLSASPTSDTLRITVKDLGDGSHALAALPVGTRVAVEGPYGRLHAGARSRDRVTLLASGIGVTPLRALLDEVAGPATTLVYRASDVGGLVLRDELDALAAATGTRVVYVVGRRVVGRASWLPEQAAHLTDAQALLHLVPQVADGDVYVCGASAWMTAARAAALAAGVPAGRVHLERFDW